MEEFEYKKRKRLPGEQRPTLSERDEYVPDTHIGMYSILRNEKNKNVYMGEEQCQITREKTYNGVLKIYNRYNSPSYADLWNYNIEAINECGLNYFASNKYISPIRNLIECFESGTLKNQGIYVAREKVISFGIERESLKKYLDELSDYNEVELHIKIPHRPSLRKKSRERVLFGNETYRRIGGTVEIPRNAIFNRFQHWCVLNGVSEQEGLLMAIEGLFKSYPVDGLNEPRQYNVITELDRKIFGKQHEPGRADEVPVAISGVIYGKTSEIIARYNIDPKNMIRDPMTFDDYVNNALYLLNSKMPKKYRDPELIEEQRETEKMERMIK